MANVACWYQTQLPTKIIDILIDDIENLKPEGFLIKSKDLELITHLSTVM